MTVKTLTYIHQLLIENEARLTKARDLAYEARNEAEEKDLDALPALEDVYEKARESRNNAMRALAEFENREW